MAVNWTDKQLQVIECRNRNLLVSAAAGSGKTAVLVERIIRMISQGEHPMDIDQLLIMTFTNAAAAEMRERIGAAVEQRLKENPANEHLWLQAALIPQAQITTIDSFCLNIIRTHYNTLDIDPAFRIGDEGELSLLQGDVMGKMLEERYAEADQAFIRFVEHFGRGKSDKGIEDVILKVWQFSQSHPWPEEWLADCEQELEEETIGEIEKSPWMRFLLEDAARQMEELAAQIEGALEVCREENGPLAYEPMLMNDKKNIEAAAKAAAGGSYEELYESLHGITFGRLASIRSKDIDQEKKARVSACRDRVKKAVGKCRELYGAQSPAGVLENLGGVRDVLKVLLRLAGEFDAAYREAKQGRNVLDFNDLEHLALNVLLEKEEAGQNSEEARVKVKRRPSPVADELSRQYEEILVDEYQDSNYVQEELIKSISRERSGRPNVFMVGDVKQSIYRFRLARPELFMDKYESYSQEEGLYQKIELRQNFRSRESVLTSVNDVFYQIMTKNLGGITYTEDAALYPGAGFAPVGPENLGDREEGWEGACLCAGTPTELLLADVGAESLKGLDEEALDYTAKELEARLIAGRIREITSEDQGLLVWDKGLEKYRRAGYGDMVILLRSMTGWSEVFVNVLMNEGIPALAQTRTGYFNTVEVETVLSLLSVIDNPMQDIPLAAVMRSPIVGMSDEEMAWLMAAYKGNSKKAQDRGVYAAMTLWRGEETGWEIHKEREPCNQRADDETEHGQTARNAKGSRASNAVKGIDGAAAFAGGKKVPEALARSISEKLEKLCLMLKKFREEARHVTIHELLYRIYRESGYYDYVSAMPAGETRRGNLDMLVEKAASYESTSYKGLFHFVRYIEKLKKFDTDFGEANGAGSQDSAVRIMSIHKSKGLEFPIVFLAGMGKRFNKQDAYGPLLLDADLGVAADYLDPEARVKAPTLKKMALRRRMELESMGEELRVLYVAMTRAKEKLIMTATDKSLEGKMEKWADLPLVRGQIPYTILSSANSFLDWILMAKSAIPDSHIQMRQADVKSLVGKELTRQIIRKTAKEDLLQIDTEKPWNQELWKKLDRVMSFQYPYKHDTGLYAMVSVSELKKQSQIGRDFDSIGTEDGAMEGAGLAELAKLTGKETSEVSGIGAFSKDSYIKDSGGARRGVAYHGVLERISFHDINSLAGTRQALDNMLEQGFLDQETHGMVSPSVIWRFISGPLGRRMARAQEEKRLRRETQFIIGIPAREMGLGDSSELILVQGVVDAYIEEPDGLVLIDYKTDYVPKEDPVLGARLLAERYRVQLEYYERALTQLTGLRVKERLLYSLALQESITV